MDNLDEQVMLFIRKIRPQLTMGELQTVAALAVFLKSGDVKDIPGYRTR